MKKIFLALAVILTATSAMAGQNEKVLELAPQFDKRIKMAYIPEGIDNTVVLQGHWPKTFAANNVADGWCIEFDSTIRHVILADMRANILANVICK